MLRCSRIAAKAIIAHLSDASVALAMQHRKVGKYTEARALLEGVLAVDPNNAAAKRELGYLDDPIRTNPALTYEHTQNIDKVRRTLYTAEGNYNLGKYDDAKREYEKVHPPRSLQLRRPPRPGAHSPRPSPTTTAPPTTTPARNCSRKWMPPGNSPFPPIPRTCRRTDRPEPGRYRRRRLHHRKTPPHHHSQDRFR